MPWHASLDLNYRREGPRTVAHFRHQGPLRVLRSLYPEGEATCHNVLVHPPGGLVGGDTLDIRVQARAGAQALITTPGATRFYRCEAQPARQRAVLALEAGARLEWLPQETLCHPGCDAENELRLSLAEGAELMGWDVTALGLPASAQPFASGRLLQHVEWSGRWLERGRIDAADARLMNGPLGLAGQRCLGMLFWLCGTPATRDRRELALALARECIEASPLRDRAGATALRPGVVVVRVLAPLTEPVTMLLRAIRAAWHGALWHQEASVPRIWST